MYKLKDLSNNEKKVFFTSLKYYVYIYCSIEDDNSRKPIYIGHGKSERCLDHIKDLENKSDTKSLILKKLYNQKKLDIDIIAHKLDKETALTVESACIDLIGVNNLENIIKGQGENIKRIPIEELSNKYNQKYAEIEEEHRGFVIIVNKLYKPYFNDHETLETVRGIWKKIQLPSLKILNVQSLHLLLIMGLLKKFMKFLVGFLPGHKSTSLEY